MNRLTKRSGINYIARNKYCNYDAVLTDAQLEAAYQQCVDKLGQLEDIEEELGIDLITLNKLRKADKIYVKFFDDIQEWNKTRIDLRYCKIWYGYYTGKGYGLSQPLSNYGTGFALTREELKNE